MFVIGWLAVPMKYFFDVCHAYGKQPKQIDINQYTAPTENLNGHILDESGENDVGSFLIQLPSRIPTYGQAIYDQNGAKRFPTEN